MLSLSNNCHDTVMIGTHSFLSLSHPDGVIVIGWGDTKLNRPPPHPELVCQMGRPRGQSSDHVGCLGIVETIATGGNAPRLRGVLSQEITAHGGK